MAWSKKWHFLASEKELDEPDYSGAAAYKLGVGGARGGNIVPVFVGKAANVKNSLSQHGQEKSHLKKKIRAQFKNQKKLFYKIWKTDDAAEAEDIKFLELRNIGFPWNQKGDGLDF